MESGAPCDVIPYCVPRGSLEARRVTYQWEDPQLLHFEGEYVEGPTL